LAENRHLIRITFLEVLQMPAPKALKIELTDAESEHIEKTVREQTATQRQVKRTNIVLSTTSSASRRSQLTLHQPPQAPVI